MAKVTKVRKSGSGKGVKYGLRTPTDKRPNQWRGTPQQEKFLSVYLDPKSDTFANAYTSALAVGYEESYAKIIAAPSVNRVWLNEARNLVRMGPEHLRQALQDEGLDMMNKASDRIRALELLGKMEGVFVEKKIVAHVGIDQALRELRQ